MHGVAQDVTDEQRSEETRVRLEAQLRAAQKLEAIGTLAGGIAHDFNNILAAIMGYVELAKSDVPDHAVLQADLDEVFKATVRAKELVQQILAFSRQPERGSQLVRLQTVVKESMKLLRPGLPSTVEITDRIDSTTPLVQGDATQLQQVVVQLVTNAAHSVPDRGGVVEVKVAPAWVDEPMAAANPGLKAGRHATLCVRDEGHGMTPEVLERIFDPFFTTKTPGEGTGLGLSVVRSIVKAHHGAILVQSAPDQGSTFAVYLPAVDTQADSIPNGTVPLVRANGQRVLLVDDEPALAEAGRRWLEGVGYRVTVFTSGPAAWEAFQKQPGGFDLAVTDYTMPGLTGADLARRMLSLRPGLPILLTTGYSAQLTGETVAASGARAVLMKPYTPERLCEMIQQCLSVKTG
jgi:nitrogen-specific signal transduction histidine kinase/ActR/RegA family two-component response regulator